MSVELLNTLSIVSFILAGVFLVLTIALFFLLKIKKVYGDISGSTARREIEGIRQRNVQTGEKAHGPSPVNASRGKTTEKIGRTGKTKKSEPVQMSGHTAKLSEAASETTVLANETTVLGNETTVLSPAASETTVLYQQPTNETTVLSDISNEQLAPSFGAPAAPGYAWNPVAPASTPQNVPGVTVEVEMGFIGSSEIIT